MRSTNPATLRKQRQRKVQQVLRRIHKGNKLVLSSNIKFNKNADFSQIERAPSPESEDELTVGNVTLTKEIPTSSNPTSHNISQELVSWSIGNNISHVAINGLLKILRSNFPSTALPKDARTLLKTPRKIDIQNIAGGSFHYFGIKSFLVKALAKPVADDKFTEDRIVVSVSVDGLPITKSNDLQFWPIQAKIDNLENSKPWVVALFYGNGKPLNLDLFLHDFVLEATELMRDGIRIGEKQLNFKIKAFIADAPARAFLKCCKNHNAYYGCERCVVKGDYRGRVVFLRTDLAKRTNESFQLQSNFAHHNGVSPLLQIGIDMVTEFPIDYMHLVCLGVMKKLLKAWVKGPHKIRLKGRELVNQHLRLCSKFIPEEFSRKPRSLKYVSFFKATEFRTFLLYTGMVVLREVLPEKYYRHFLKLQCAIFILLSNKAKEFSQVAKGLLIEFVQECILLYGKTFLVYNVHSLIHLADDAVKFGSLDNVSAFPFENAMQSILKYLRGKNQRHLSQVVMRICEQELNNFESPQNRRTSNKYVYKGVVVSSKPGDNCFLVKALPIIVVDVTGQTINYRECECKKLKNYPLISSSLSMFRVTGYGRLKSGNVSILTQKCVLLPRVRDAGALSIDFVCIPFTLPLCAN